MEKEKTKTINKLRKSVNRLQDIIETTPDLVWEIDQKGIYTYISSQVKVLLGYEVSELLGKPAYSIMSKEEKERIKQIIMEEKPSFRLLSTVPRQNNLDHFRPLIKRWFGAGRGCLIPGVEA
ncbi:PAS domain S-box protein [Candidatus Latescibacterota bacterium]